MSTPSVGSSTSVSSTSSGTLQVSDNVLDGFGKDIEQTVSDADGHPAYQDLAHFATGSGFGPSGYNVLMAGSTKNFPAAADLAGAFTSFCSGLNNSYGALRKGVSGLPPDLVQVKMIMDSGEQDAESTAGAWLTGYASDTVGMVASGTGGTSTAPVPSIVTS